MIHEPILSLEDNSGSDDKSTFCNLDIVSNTNSTDIDQWDSLNHLNLMSSIEEEFNIKFDFEEIGSLKNIGDIVKIVSEKL